jgi:uncharacterized protein
MSALSLDTVPREALAEYCRSQHIRKLAVFGSTIRGEAKPDSDVDVLVEFEAGHTPGFGFIRIQEVLSAYFGGRKVDLNTPKCLSRYFREEVAREAVVLYGAQ